MFERVAAWFHAVGAARRHVVNWPELVLKAVFGQDGVSSLKLEARFLAMGKSF